MYCNSEHAAHQDISQGKKLNLPNRAIAAEKVEADSKKRGAYGDW